MAGAMCPSQGPKPKPAVGTNKVLQLSRPPRVGGQTVVMFNFTDSLVPGCRASLPP